MRILVLTWLVLAGAWGRGAAAQAFADLFRRDTLEWRAWAAGSPSPDSATLRTLGVCANQIQNGGAYFHFLDVDADGRLDLVYSGPHVLCDRNLEGESTTLYLNRGRRLRRVFRAPGRVISMWRPVPWAPVAFALRADGCCADPHYEITAYFPRVARDELAFEPGASVAATSETTLPDEYFGTPRPFLVEQDHYRLRTRPEVDDSTEGALMEGEGRRGNVQATFARGSRGVALAARRDSSGRPWWFVIMRSPPVGAQPPVGGRPPRWHAGWMSARFLQVDSTAPAGRIDGTGIPRRSP